MAIQRNFRKNFFAFSSGDTAQSDTHTLGLLPLKDPGFPELRWMRNTFSMITLDCQASRSLFSSLSATFPPIFAYLEAIPFQSYVGRDSSCQIQHNCRIKWQSSGTVGSIK
jgi:hypothetical protein